MLVSHSKKFIYLKTLKTAGTSLEIALEEYCAAPGHVSKHNTPESISEHGIIGARGAAFTGGAKFKNHMSAQQVKKQIDPEIWSGYTEILRYAEPV